MRVAIVHYHLQPGGVTRVIEHSVRALNGKPVDIVVLTGKSPPREFPGKWSVVEGLQYEADRPDISARELADSMVQAAEEALGGMPDLWHVHNHSLGKNMVLPSTLVDLAKQGHRLLLHIHDFAEDGRPANYRMLLHTMAEGSGAYLASQLYPGGGHVHYGVLNTRDYGYMQAAGAEETTLHLLTNPVDLALGCYEEEGVSDEDDPLWIYPTRAIRRKNIGEFLLWAATAPDGYRFATTLGPDNPLERPRYERWRTVAGKLNLPVEFERGRKQNVSFVELLRQARGLMTTSIAEGFGLAFMEPWLVGRPVMGRSLPEITGEFCKVGVKLPWVYEQIGIPLEWLGRERVVTAAREGLMHSLEAYGRRPGRFDMERLLSAWIHKETVDFGRLDESMQESVLERVTADDSGAACMVGKQLTYPANEAKVIAGNCSILKKRYSLTEYGNTLFRLYEKIAGSSATHVHSLDGESLLDHFLAPERLQLLRVD